MGIDIVPYSPYSIDMTRANRKIDTKGAEEARRQLPALVAAAADGRTTIITRHGRAVAAVVPADSVSAPMKQSPITTLAGTGKGLWGTRGARSIAKLRDEWSR